MEIRQLKYFVGIAETGRFSDASKELFISQSAVSQQIKLLEEELGTQLFIRYKHGVTLTESGQELLPYAKQVLKSVSDCYDRIADLKGLLCGELNVGLTYTLEPYLRATMLRFMKAYPKVQLNAHYKNLSELLKKLRLGEIDIMLSMMPTSPHDFCESVPLLEYRLAAVMRKTHPLAGKKELTFDDLRHQSLILPEKGLRDRNAIESFIHTDTGDLNVRALVSDVNAILNLLQESGSVSILAENITDGYPNLCTVPITGLTAPVRVYAHFNRDSGRKHSADVLVDMFKESSAFCVQKRKMSGAKEHTVIL
ncbi:MAG: LysR family transcriptional regulator [Bacteroidaceae bacterium]|nr:LysR family transcriptional regulator [Bacteroidaceae bacterium]